MKLFLSVLFALWASSAFADPVDVTIIVDGKTVGVHHGQTKHAKGSGQAAVQVDGTLNIIHADYDGSGDWDYGVVDSKGKRTRLNIDTLPPNVRGGAKVRVKGNKGQKFQSPSGIAADDEVDPSSLEVLGLTLPATATSNVAFLIVQFSDQANPPVSVTGITAQVALAKSWFTEVSYGQVAWSGTVQVTKIANKKPTTCDFTSWTGAAMAAAGLSLLDMKGYTNVYFITALPCGWKGLAYAPGMFAYANGSAAGLLVFAHELGHNYGLMHAGSITPGVGKGIGSATEYGDPHSVMGNQHAGHYNAFQKWLLTWATHQTYDARTATQPETFTIGTLETTNVNNGVQILTGVTDRRYFLEYRQPIGADAAYTPAPSGVRIMVTAPFEVISGGDDSEVVGIAGSWFLPVGVPFLDGKSNLSVLVKSQDANGAVVQVGPAVAAAGASSTQNATVVPALKTAVAALTVGSVTDPQVSQVRGLAAQLMSDAPTTLQNWSFESPFTNGITYAPAGIYGWAFVGNAGVAKNAAFGNPPAPDGVQCLFLQSAGAAGTYVTGVTGSVVQTLTLAAGSYTLKFNAARRGSNNQPIAVSVDGVTIGMATPTSNTAYAPFAYSFSVAAGTHTVSLSATNGTGDNTAFVDTVTLQ